MRCACGSQVIEARGGDGRRVFVEEVEQGQGFVALAADLFGGLPTVEATDTRTRLAVHVCPRARGFFRLREGQS